MAKARQWTGPRLSTTERGYGTAWQKLRRQVLVPGSVCVVCGTSGSPSNPLTVDHIVAKANGGKDELANLQVLCRAHNSSKGAK